MYIYIYIYIYKYTHFVLIFKYLEIYKFCFTIFIYLFLAVLGFELRAPCLLGRCLTTYKSHPQSPCSFLILGFTSAILINENMLSIFTFLANSVHLIRIRLHLVSPGSPPTKLFTVDIVSSALVF
jgi:hypothetical protein